MKAAKTTMERITARNPLIGAYNVERNLREMKFVVDLACGHKAYTGAVNRAVCPRCTEMLRRSLQDGREDWDSFRKGLIEDHMEWPEDPCRQFNERGPFDD